MNMHTQLHCAYGNSCMHSNNVRQWVKHVKGGNTDIANQLCSGDLRCAATERNKGKIREHQRESVCDSERNVSRYWSRAHYCPGGTGKFGILRSLCLVGFSLVDGKTQASMKKNISSQLMKGYLVEGYDFFHGIMIVDEK